MTDTEFFYWLQGYFELTGTAPPITCRQADCILSHAALVEESARPGQRVSSRLFEIRSLCRVIASLDSESDHTRARLTREVADIVSAQFQHVIDPKAGGPEKQEHFNSIHNQHLHSGSGGGLPPGVVARC